MKSYNIDIDSLDGMSAWPEHVRLNAVVDVKIEENPNEGDVRTHIHMSWANAKKLHAWLGQAISDSSL